MKKGFLRTAALTAALVLGIVSIPFTSAHAEEMVTIQCKDQNFYKCLVYRLTNKVSPYYSMRERVTTNDDALSITMLKSDVDSIVYLDVHDDQNSEYKIEDITGVENF